MPENKTPIRVMVVNSDKSPLQLAIMFNAKHLNWSTNDYMEAYPEFELKAAIQLIKGKHSTKDFKEGYRSCVLPCVGQVNKVFTLCLAQ